MKDALARINHSVWEFSKLVAKHPENYTMRADFLRYFHESRLFGERRGNVPEDGRSFLMLQERESLCCYLLHGIGGSPSEMRPLGEYLFKAGYTVYGARLALGDDGGGVPTGENGSRRSVLRPWRRDRRGRAGYDWERCLADADVVLSALLTFSPNVYAFGFSFGGAVALNLLRDRPLKGAVLIAPGLFPAPNGRSALFSVMRTLAPFVAREAFPREHALLAFTERTRARIAAVAQPVLVIQASRDRVVSPRSLRFIKERAKNPKSRFEIVDSARHVLVTGDEAKRVYPLCADFLREI